MDKNDDLYKNLIILLKIFKNRPYHLAKYLIDNSSLSKEFIKKLLSSNKLNELSDEETNNPSITPVYFVDISQMDEFYTSLIDITKSKNEIDLEEITKELNDKLDNYIITENYEEAVGIRDYMLRNGIKRIKKI